jgi:hypothetical protein
LADICPELEGIDRQNQALKNVGEAAARALAVLVHGWPVRADA